MLRETTSTQAVPGRTGRTAPRRALTVAGATAAALVLWTLAGPVAGIGLTVRLDGAIQSIGAGSVAAASLVVGLAAWVLLALLERVLKRPGLAWTVIAIVTLALSLTGPLAAVDTASMVALGGMHLIVAAVLIPGLGRSAKAG
ncbi:hypothetical protein IMZ11_10735 [Microtetraspora sp. AC03309]|uniref:DUF6069 family protein n=1 Tax=Microtetraspora sp. AC03309 TaxID=2779376 RepID=UPI001E5BD1B1|nr:DUF6069 family protein [Microtetraspora sp. AC03309]MCC5576113.1 hypothetical protein [Microtetraspora sp. AC03309]